MSSFKSNRVMNLPLHIQVFFNGFSIPKFDWTVWLKNRSFHYSRHEKIKKNTRWAHSINRLYILKLSNIQGPFSGNAGIIKTFEHVKRLKSATHLKGLINHVRTYGLLSLDVGKRNGWRGNTHEGMMKKWFCIFLFTLRVRVENF